MAKINETNYPRRQASEYVSTDMLIVQPVPIPGQEHSGDSRTTRMEDLKEYMIGDADPSKIGTPAAGTYTSASNTNAQNIAALDYALANYDHLTKQVATQSEINGYISDPTTASFNVIYLLKDESATGSDKYFEYQRLGTAESSTFEMTGDTSTDLSDYYTKSEVNTALGNKADKVSNATSGHIAALDSNGNLTDSGKTLGKSVPSDAVFTDTNNKVAQTASSGNSDYEVLFSSTADNTTRTEGARKNNNLKFNPSTGNLQATQLNGAIIGSSPKFTDTTYSMTRDGENIKLSPSSGTEQSIGLSDLINGLSTGTDTPADDDYYVAQYANGGTSQTAYYRRKVSALWNYIKSKIGIASSGSTFLRKDGTWATPTNTKNTAGSTDSSSKLFLIGATSQAANPQTYSHDTAYVGTDGCLYSGGTKVLTAHQTIKQDGITGATINRYGVCSDSTSTQLKTVSLTAGTFSKEAGARVTVKFTYENSADEPMLQIGSDISTVGDIYHKGVKIASDDNKYLLAGVCDFVYDGTNWNLVGNYLYKNYSVVSKTANGLAPQLPNETTTTKYLRQDGTWVKPPNDNTKNTAGSTDSSSKLFLIGATSQAANPQTYSHDTAYVGTDGCLYSDGKKVFTAHYKEGSTVVSTANQAFTVTISDSNISTSSVILSVCTSVKGLDYNDITLASGSCTVSFIGVASAQTVTVGIVWR